MSLFDTIVAVSAKMAEVGLIATETAITAAQTTLEGVAGIRRDPGVKAPVKDPRDLDHALSELANRTARIFHYTPANAAAVPGAIKDWLRALKTSFRYVDWKDPRSLTLPMQLPFSLGALLAQTGLRGLVALEAIGAPRYIEFLKYSIQIFSEFPVYVGLEYADVIERQR